MVLVMNLNVLMMKIVMMKALDQERSMISTESMMMMKTLRMEADMLADTKRKRKTYLSPSGLHG